jgi:protein-disulfide isomerase
MPVAKWLLIGILGLASGFGSMRWLQARKARAAQKAASAAAAAAPAGSEPDPRFVYKVELLDSPARGPADAPITIVAFGAYDAASRELDRTLNELAASQPKNIRLVWKDAPATPEARVAALGARAAETQGKFWEMHARLMQATGPVDVAALQREAQALGINPDLFTKAYDHATVAEKIDADAALAATFGVAAPAVFVNGHYVKNPTLARLRDSVSEAQSFVANLLQTGTPPDRIYSALMRGALPAAGPIGALLGLD